MQSIESNGAKTAYNLTGTGVPVVLLHGGEATHAMFDGLSRILASRFTVIAYDQRDSGGTENPSSQYSLADLADDAAEVIAGLGYDRAHVFGTSMGGLIAQVLATRHPDKIDRLVLGSTWKVGRSPLDVNEAAFKTLAGYRPDTAVNAPNIARYFFPEDTLRARPELIEIFRGNNRNDGQKVRRSAVLSLPVSMDLPRFDRPTLLLAGREDKLIPYTETFALADQFARAETMLLDGASHVSSIQMPERVAQALMEFLTSNKEAA